MRVIANFKENLIRDLLLQGVPQKKIAAQAHTSCRVVSRIASQLKPLNDQDTISPVPDVKMDPHVDQQNQENRNSGKEIPEPLLATERISLSHIFQAFKKQYVRKSPDWFRIAEEVQIRLHELISFHDYVTRNGRKKYFD